MVSQFHVMENSDTGMEFTPISPHQSILLLLYLLFYHALVTTRYEARFV